MQSNGVLDPRRNKIEFKDKERIKKKIEEAAEEPTRYKHLHYDLKGSCRLRIGKLRIIFSYDEGIKEIYLEKVVFDHNYQS